MQIGILTDKIINLLKISNVVDRHIYIGETNEKHMQTKHPVEYVKYRSEIENIIQNPDYVGLNPKDSSIEYVKEFKVDNEYVKVAVRVSTLNKLYVRSMYILNENKVRSFISKNRLIRY